MRLSSLVIAAILIVSTTLLAQHTTSAASSSAASSFASHSSSGGSSSASHTGSSHSSSGSVAPSNAPAPRPSSSTAIKSPYVTRGTQPGKPAGRSLFHPFRKPHPIERTQFIHPQPCWHKPCSVCPAGQSRNGRGACIAVSSACLTGGFSYGFFCSTPYWWSNQCRVLAGELASLEQRMRGESNPALSLEYQRLREQYEECLRRTGGMNSFGYYALDGGLFDVP